MITQPQTVTDPRAVPPGPRGYPLVGVLPHLLRDSIGFLTETAQQYGDVASMRLGPQRLYMLNHPDHIKHVLQTNNRSYRKGLNFRVLKVMFGDGLGTSDGEFWLRQRRLTQPAFHHQRLAAMASKMVASTNELVERWQGFTPKTQQFDVVEEMKYLTQQIIVTTMFSSSIKEDTKAVCAELDLALKCLNRSLWLSALPNRLIPGYRQLEQALERLDKVLYRIIDESRRSNEDRGDFLSMLLQVRDEDTGEGMSDKQVRDEVMTLFFAGHETAATTVSWIFHYLAQHTEVEAQLHAEVDSVLGGRTPTFQDLPQLAYTKRVMEETLRLQSPVWGIFRTPIVDDVINGYRIPAGSIVLLSPFGIHRSPAFWEQPEQFDPDRFLPENSANRPRYAYVPFGAGPRLCMGNHFALMETQIILAMVAQRYRLQSVPGHPVEPSISLMLRARHGIRMTLEPRTPQA
jgi:cytochrome P450